MTSHHEGGFVWETATDAEEVHGLLCASDRAQGERSGTPVPRRGRDSTRRAVAAGEVGLLRHGEVAVGTFTLTTRAPFDLEAAPYEGGPGAMYLRRLAVRPSTRPEYAAVGVRCVRRAVELASEQAATRLRAEANPDLSRTYEMLVLLGFQQKGGIHDDGSGRRWVYLEKSLFRPSGRSVKRRRDAG